jgi:outer membrane protein TolC
MRSLSPFCLATLLAVTEAVVTGAPRAHADPLKLEDAIAGALAHNERAAKVPLRVDVAEGGLDRAREAFFPTLTAGTTATLQPSQAKAIITPSTLVLAQPLLVPSAFPLYKQAKETLDSETWGALADRRQLEFDTARAFLLTLNAERVLIAAKEHVAAAMADLKDTQARVDAKLASTNDATRAEVALAAAQGAQVSALASVVKAYIALGFVVGTKVDPPIAEPVALTTTAQTFDLDVAAQLDAAFARRPDVRSAHSHTDSLKSFADEPLYRLAPTISLLGTMKADPSPTPPTKEIDGTVAVALTWTIFDGGFRYSDRKIRLAQLESGALDEASLKRSVQSDISTALVSLKAARDALKIAEAGVTASKKNVDETAVLYKQGLARAIEVTDATASLFAAEITYETAKVSTEQAYLDLRQALGFAPLDLDDTKIRP